MTFSTKFRYSDGNWFDRFHGSFVVLGTVVLLELSRQLGILVPNPQLFTALAVTYAAYTGGYAGGLAGAAIGIAYALYFFSSPDELLHFTAINRAKVFVNVITLPAIALLVSRLSHRLAASLVDRSQRFIESANAPILAVDREGRVSLWNDNLEKATGWSENDTKSRNLAELLPDEEQRTMFAEALEAIFKGHDAARCDFSISTMSGDAVQLLIGFTPRLDTRGNVVGMTGVGQDITERKKAESALRESELKLREILENSPVGIAIVSHDLDGTRLTGDRLFVNSALVQMFGGTSGESFLKGRIQDSWVDLEQLKAVEKTFKRRRELVDFEARRRRLDGSEWWASMNARPIRFEGQDCTMVWHFDITQRKRSEFELRESEKKLKEAQKIGKIGYWRGDTTTGGIEWSDEVYHIFGQDPESFEPNIENLKTAIHPDDLNLFTRSIEVAQNGAEGSAADFRIVLPDGSTRWVHAESRADVDGRGNARAFSGTLQDITERIEREEALSQAQKMEAVGQLTGGVAHDFNNLLTIIQGNAELLAYRSDTVEPYTSAIMRATARGAELTQRLLAFSRQQPLRPQAIDLGKLVTGMSDLLKRTLGETIEIEAAVGPGLCIALADPGQLESALLNLALNARDAMPEGGKLTIRCEKARLEETDLAQNAEAAAGDYVVLAVTDTGSGMSPEVREHAFEPFFSTKDVGEGSGLGLSIVYGFAKQSGGHAVIDSQEGQGTTVRLYLPRTEQLSQPDEAVVFEEVPGGRNETVLVLEDDGEVRETVVTVLEDLGYRVLAVPEADKALEALDAEPVEVVLSDVVLTGGMSGPQFAEEARRRHPGTKVVFMSGYSAEAGECTETPALEGILLNKPFEKSQLAKALRQALD
jgi:PAS domain S-box-containing protein